MTGLRDAADIPEPWRKLLASIQTVCPSAVLAGGALRDIDNARPVKDLDIFIHAKGDREAFMAIELLRVAGFDISFDTTFGAGQAYPEDQNLEVVQIADLHDGPLPAQLIFTNWPTERIVERFDYGICRLSFDGQSIVRPPEYDEDREAQLFRLRRDRPTPISMRGSIRRFARLTNDKYQGWDWAAFEEPCPFGSAAAAR